MVSGAVFFNIDIIANFLGASDEIADMVKDYIQIISVSGPFVMLSACLSNLFRAEGRAKESMFGMMLGNIVNIILDPIFILGLELGVTGAAIATLIGNTVGGVYFIILLLKRDSALSSKLKDFSAEKNMVFAILSIGVPASVATLLMSISQIVLNAQMSAYGDLAVAGIGVATKVSMMTSMIFIGLGQGVQPLLGYCIGAGNQLRYKSIIRFSLCFAFSLSAVLTAICYLNINAIVGSFLSEPLAFDYALNFSLIRLPTAILFGMFFVLINALQATGATKSSLVVNISRQGLIFIPAVFILGELFGEVGLVLAQPVADVSSFILVLILYIIISRKIFTPKTNIQ